MSERFATPFDQPDPDAVARSDRFIDALANGEPVDADTALAGLLGDWRDELRVPASGGGLQRVVAPAAGWRWWVRWPRPCSASRDSAP
jgi:hypothetical protein